MALTMALSLAVAYALALPLPYIAPILSLSLSMAPAPPIGVKALLSLVLVMCLMLGVGLLLIPVLINYPLAGVLLVGLGLYLSTYLAVNKGQALVGTLLTVGLTFVPIAGVYSFALAVAIIQALVIAMGLAIVCLWLVYPWFPEEPGTEAEKPDYQSPHYANWIALRVALIVLPPFLLALTNPALYLKVILKSVLLGQQGSMVDARNAGTELLGSTFLAGLLTIVLWVLLKLSPDLWMFFCWMLLFGVGISAKTMRVSPSRYSASFWQNVAVTTLILLGSAVQDSANGDDVYGAFAVRMTMFIGVTLYAWGAIFILERWRSRSLNQRDRPLIEPY
ncbi:MAG: hypothetical protein ACJAYG_001978 [Oceanicoccus sp.]|jgi:hypothetical protein